MIGSAKLNRKVVFLSPVEGLRSPTGGSKMGWAEEFTVAAKVSYLRGGETVMASRMSGRRPAVLTMRRRENIDAISLDWIVRFDGVDFEVRELPKRSEDGHMVDMLVEAKL